MLLCYIVLLFRFIQLFATWNVIPCIMFLDEGIDIPPKSPIGNVGLGSASQNNTQKNGCYIVLLFRFIQLLLYLYLYMAFNGIRAYALNGKRTSSLMAFNGKNLLRLPFSDQRERLPFIAIHCHFFVSTTNYSLLSNKKDRYTPRVMVFLCAHSHPFALRYSRSSWLDYVATNVHLLKLWAKIEKRIQNSK